MQRACVFCACLVVVVSLPASAGVEFFEVPSPEWDAALEAAGKVSKGDTDFDRDLNYPVSGFAGPLTSEGGGPVSPGIVLDNMSIFGPLYFGRGTDLVSLGPNYGWGNPTNVIMADYFIDSLQIDIDDPGKTAMSMQVFSTSNRPSDVTVFDANGVQLGVGSVPSNDSIGILATDGDRIGGINIFDPENGAEGFMKATAYNIPEPTSIALLALGVAAAVRRHLVGRAPPGLFFCWT
jgi:hypothetical protein